MSGGWNPVTGRDATGTRPEFSPYGAPMHPQGGPYIAHTGGPGYNFGTVSYYSFPPQMAYGIPISGNGAPVYQQAATAAYAQGYPASWYAHPSTYSYQPNGANNAFHRSAQPYPNIDPNMPAAQFTNSSGGTGCEPGYNYFFPPSHTKAHVFRSNTPPWQLPHTTQIQFKAVHIPCSTTCEQLLKGFGCTNATPKKNRCFELISGGGGKWYKGLELNGSDKDMMKKTIGAIGWDETRTGLPGEKPVVCLWFSKE